MAYLLSDVEPSSALSLRCLPPQDRRIYLSESDFMNITNNGTLCNDNGEIGLEQFHAIMRSEVPPINSGRGMDKVEVERVMSTEK